MLRSEAVGLCYRQAGGAADSSVRAGAPAEPEVLLDSSFQLDADAFRWLLGPSDAGRVSVIRLLILAVRPIRGRLDLHGVDVTTAPRRALPPPRCRIGVVFQNGRLMPKLSAFDNMALPLCWVGLSRHPQTHSATLSCREQQCIAIERAVITGPVLLVADETTVNIDEAQTERLMQLFKELNRIDTTVIVATHNHSFVARYPVAAPHITNGRLSTSHMPIRA